METNQLENKLILMKKAWFIGWARFIEQAPGVFFNDLQLKYFVILVI